MQKNLASFDRAARLFLGIISLLLAAVIFSDPFARLFALAFGVYAVWECASGKCPLHAKLGLRAPADLLAPETAYLLGLAAIQLVLAYAWLSAGWEKVSGAAFAGGLAKTLGYFASKNPFPWYKAFLLGPATSYATPFGYVIEWGELAVGIGLAACAVAILISAEAKRRQGLIFSVAALAAGMLMNANFYFAAGWTGAGTKGDNVAMFWVAAALAYVWASSLRKPSA